MMLTTKRELKKFKDTVERSANIIVITDAKQIITYVNEAFSKITGYSTKEAIGQKPSILNSGKQSKAFYQEMHNTIYSGKEWTGEFINVDKYGNLSYEKASIMPVLNEEGEIEEFIAVKLDVTQEVLTRQKLEYARNETLLINKQLEQRIKEEVQKNRLQDQKIMEQARTLQMGEMISMIAHQWRQPLSTIAAISMDLRIKAELQYFDLSSVQEREAYQKYLSFELEKIERSTQDLTEIIDNFKSFYKPLQPISSVNINTMIEKTLTLISNSLELNGISVEYIFNSKKEIKLYCNEMMKVLLNLLKNTQDTFMQKKISHGEIWISTEDTLEGVRLNIYDNAGGIDETIISKIFDPYFSTKDEKNGTGLGLYMSKLIIEKHHQGTITAHNTKSGVCFSIELKGEVT